ncbi:MAG: PAS domain S-box protein, partial [Candidatus Thorarchaeota archaeon]|nr:PAS domain S-box protein [Candidatus Thorarchaeota archaeon]
MTRDEESQYSRLFVDSPVALWEEDFSKVKKFIDELRISGVTDFRQYFKEHHEDLLKCVELVEILRVNKATMKLQGVETEDELLGSLTRILDDDALDLVLGEIVALAEGKSKFEDTVELSTVTGEYRTTLLVLSVPDGFRDTWSRVIISMLDITETVETKKALANERRAFQIIAEAALEPLYTSETSHRILNGMIELLDLDLGTLRLYDEKKGVLSLHASIGIDGEVQKEVSLDDSEYMVAQVARTKTPIFMSDIDPESIMEKPLLMIKELGIKSLIFWPIIGPNEELLGVLNVASKTKKNLSEKDRTLFQMVADMLATVIIRHNAQEALRSSEERYRLLAENVSDVICIFDMDFVFTYLSPSCDQIFGYSPEELIGKSVTLVLPEESQKIASDAMNHALKMEKEKGKDGYEAPPLDMEVLHKDGSKLWTELSRVFLRDENGHPVATLGVARDITERRLTARKLEEALQTAAFYNDLMAHDISNMQQGIMSSMELMLYSGSLPEELKHLVEAALSQSERGAALVGHVKKLAEVEEETINLSQIDPYAALIDAFTMVRNTFHDKDIKIETNMTEGKYSVLADEFLVDVFYNLLHNSVRLDSETTVHIDIDADENRDGFLTVRITDCGPGIEDSVKNSIFSRIGTDGKRVAGIGLTLVKRIFDRYGGTIYVEDKVKDDYSRGTCFVFELPTGP